MNDASHMDEQSASEAQTAPIERNPDSSPDGGGSRTQPRATQVDRQIGSYHIVREIASGGMGTVYEAIQDSPRRTVALKLMKHGMTSRSVLRRFEYESQILGHLSHPNIAQVFEAGTHDEGSGGVPYFAMEFIPDAQTITDFAHRQDLSLRERLGLYTKVCDAVHHGHQKGIIHRDLKPGNILIDAHGEPKIIDFGVARATDSDIAVTTAQTDVGQLIGTLQYMSPEQCDADPNAIDTRSDVYALGVILYELLCGQMPYHVHRKAIHEVVRVIKEEAATRLSTVDRKLRGDLETIARKALEKSRERRYQSALELKDDIERFLKDEPIEARPPSVMYQLGKFARRNKVIVGSVGLLLMVMIAATVISIAFALYAGEKEAEANATSSELRSKNEELDRAWREEQRQREAVEQIAAFQAEQLSGIDPPSMGGQLREDLLHRARTAWIEQSAGQSELNANLSQLEELIEGINFTDVALATLEHNIFDRAVDAVDSQFSAQPLVKARLYQTLATTMLDLGLYEKAESPQRVALDIRRRRLGNDSPDTLDSIHEMGYLLRIQGNLDEAEAYYREATETSSRVLGDEHPDTLSSEHNLGALLVARGQLQEAERIYRDVLNARRRVLGDDAPDTLISMNSLGYLLQTGGRTDEAEPYYREALDTRRRVLGNDHPQTLTSINNMGLLRMAQGRLREAEPYFREAMDTRRRVLGEDHRDTLISMNTMGMLLKRQGRLTDAEPFWRKALQSGRRVLGDDHPDTLIWMSNMGALLRDMKELSEADALGAEAVRRARESLGPAHWQLATFLQDHALTLLALNRFAKSEAAALEAYSIFVDSLGDTHSRAQSTRRLLVDLYLSWHESEPNMGHEARAETWRASLPNDAD